MKKFAFIFLMTLMLITMTSCKSGNVKSVNEIINSSEIYTKADIRRGNVNNVNVITTSSKIYTNEDIDSAMNTVFRYFKKNFSGCILNEISYVGDEANKEYSGQKDEVEIIVFESSFDTDSSGVDGSFNPNDTYNEWMWILERKPNGNWKCVDYGY